MLQDSVPTLHIIDLHMYRGTTSAKAGVATIIHALTWTARSVVTGVHSHKAHGHLCIHWPKLHQSPLIARPQQHGPAAQNMQ